jgi:hypothetical protein
MNGPAALCLVGGELELPERCLRVLRLRCQDPERLIDAGEFWELRLEEVWLGSFDPAFANVALPPSQEFPNETALGTPLRYCSHSPICLESDLALRIRIS